MMTKQNYVKFADMLANLRVDSMMAYEESYNNAIERDAIDSTINRVKNDLIDMFLSDNPNFDTDRFNAYIDKRVQELTK